MRQSANFLFKKRSPWERKSGLDVDDLEIVDRDLLRLVFTSDGDGVGVVVGVIRELMT